MNMTRIDDHPPLPSAVKTALVSLRRRIRQYVWQEGVAQAVVWLGLAFWGTLAIDWFFEPHVAVRFILLAVIGIAFLYIVWRQILRRAWVPLSDGNMATILERRFSQFNDSLLTTVTLREQSAGEGGFDARMYAKTCEEAESRIGGIAIQDALNPQPLWRACMAAAILVLSVMLYAAITPESIATWAHRNLALSNELWPRNTRLQVQGFDDGVRKVARGADLEIVAQADASMPNIPQLVEVRYRTEGGARGRAVMDRRGVARPKIDAYQEYVYTFHGILGDIHFDVVGGDDRVLDRWIEVVESPKISEMFLECELPAYMARSQPLLPVTGAMQVPLGAKITVQAASNKELARVQVDSMSEDQPGPSVELSVDDFSEDRHSFRYVLPPLLKDTTLLFTLTDNDQIKSRDPIRLVLTPIADQPPQMTVQLDGIGTAVTPQARLPVRGHIADDYGIDHVWFECALGEEPPETYPIAMHAEYPTDLQISDAAVEVRSLHASPGQKMLLCVKAADRCTLGKGPNVGVSERWLLDVVTPEQLRAMLESRELVLRQRFDRIVQEMSETRDLLARLDFAATAPGKESKNVPADAEAKATENAKSSDAGNTAGESSDDEAGNDSPERRSSLRLLRVQGAITNSRKSVQEIIGVVESIEDIRKQLVNNRIDTEELKNRLQSGIADPLHMLIDQLFPELERRLDQLQASLGDVQAAPALRDRAQQQADEIILAMHKVLDRMIALEDFNEAVELLRGIIKAQEQLQENTKQRHKQKIRDLLQE
jgi:hypothetical protein